MNIPAVIFARAACSATPRRSRSGKTPQLKSGMSAITRNGFSAWSCAGESSRAEDDEVHLARLQHPARALLVEERPEQRHGGEDAHDAQHRLGALHRLRRGGVPRGVEPVLRPARPVPEPAQRACRPRGGSRAGRGRRAARPRSGGAPAQKTSSATAMSTPGSAKATRGPRRVEQERDEEVRGAPSRG